jgi:transcriptional regulator with XRE-family HTH domain
VSIRKRQLSQKEVAAAQNVSQPRISRILAGEFTRRSELAKRLCETFGVKPPHAHISDADRAFQSATGTLRSLWDGTPGDAERLDALLDAIRSVRTSPSGQKDQPVSRPR